MANGHICHNMAVILPYYDDIWPNIAHVSSSVDGLEVRRALEVLGALEDYLRLPRTSTDFREKSVEPWKALEPWKPRKS